jgi:uncharacterized protein (TIGR00369 family)
VLFGVDRDQLLERLGKVLMDAIPFNRALGMAIEDADEGVAVVRLPYRAELVGNPATGVLHGGVITSLLDASCGMSVFLKIQRPLRIATLDLRIDYLKPAQPPRVVRARAECYRVTRDVAFTRAFAYHDDLADPIAAAAATFVLFERERRDG